jgi:predicted Zn-dependent protease with MMP-like domain
VNGAVFSFGEYPDPKIPHRLHGAIPGERGDHSCLLPALSLSKGPLNVFLQGTVAFIFSTCTHVEKLTPHLFFLRELCVLLFKLFSPSSQCLRVSSEAGGKVFRLIMNDDWPILRDVADHETARLMARLPPQIRSKIINIPIIFDKFPSPSLIADGVEPDVMGLFVGDDYPHESSGPMPTEIFLFLLNIWDEAQANMPQFRAEIRKTLLHEWGHYLGLNEDELTEREL